LRLKMERLNTQGSENKESIWSQYYFHHARLLEYSPFGIVTPKYDPNDPDIQLEEGANKWLEQQIGFAPIFLAVGNTEEDIYMTGYQNQWRRILTQSKDETIYLQRGQFLNRVLFSFKDISDGVFIDYMNWFIVLNSGYRDYQIRDYEIRSIFRKSWSISDWLRYTRRDSHSVTLVVPQLDLTKADHVSVRNKTTKLILENLGFRNVERR